MQRSWHAWRSCYLCKRISSVLERSLTKKTTERHHNTPLPHSHIVFWFHRTHLRPMIWPVMWRNWVAFCSYSSIASSRMEARTPCPLLSSNGFVCSLSHSSDSQTGIVNVVLELIYFLLKTNHLPARFGFASTFMAFARFTLTTFP
jgi:hypothetical protein